MKNVLIKLAKNWKIECIISVMRIILLFLVLIIKQDTFFWISFIAVYVIDAIFTAIRNRPDYVLKQNKLWHILISNQLVIAELFFVFIGLPVILLCTSTDSIVFVLLFFIISMIITLLVSVYLSKYLDKKLIRYG